MTSESSKQTFFRQSGWMLIASNVGGVFMFLVHVFAKKMPETEYGTFFTLLNIVNLLGIPAIGLQLIFAQQTAAALTEKQRHQLTAAVRAILLGTFLIWLVAAVVALVGGDKIMALLRVRNAAALWVTILIGLVSLWLPLLLGLLQGKQEFLWLGWTAIVNGLGRFLAVAVIVGLLGAHAAGAITGVLIGMVVAFLLAAWHSRDLALGPREPFDWRSWLSRIVPLTMALGASQFMLSADVIVVRGLFSEGTGLYAAAGMIGGRALVFFTVPLTSVMFPKIARSAARSESTNVLTYAFGATALLGGTAALGCTLFPKFPLWIMYGKSYFKIAPLVPWFAWCMLPLTLANLLISNLLARERYAAAPWLVLVAAGYGCALIGLSNVYVGAGEAAFRLVVQTLGVFSLLLLAVAAWFTWKKEKPLSANAPGEAALAAEAPKPTS